MLQKKPLALVILDGWGVGSKNKQINAIEAARTPFFDDIIQNYLYTQLGATGRDVGLEENQMSGSEAGHLNIGAGRIVTQDIRLILEDIANGKFFHNAALLGAINHAKDFNSKIHLMGLMGNGDSPHSHPDVFRALLILLKKHHLENRTLIHLFTDGRDSFPQSALDHLKYWKNMIDGIGVGKIATLCGRYWAMDRAKNWDRLLKAYHALVDNQGEFYATPEEAVLSNYDRGNTDEYVEPAVLMEHGKPIGKIENNDSVIFFNSRSDRARQFTKLFVGTNNDVETNFPQTLQPPQNLAYVAMTNFGPDLKLETAYSTERVFNTLPEILGSFKQLYIAETEKYAHITFFINGGYHKSIAGEDRILIPSPIIRSYAQQPEMSAEAIAHDVCENIKYNIYDFMAINFANADMVGHTGDFKATVKAVEFLDKKLKQIYREITKKEGTMIITADHGNADIMYDDTFNQPNTFHTKNPVPFVIVSENQFLKKRQLSTGILANITPTILDIWHLDQPEEMTANSLLI